MKKNDNLLSHEKNIFSWNTLLGHLEFQHCQWIGRTSIIGNIGIKFCYTTINPPPCSDFKPGKQERTPRGNYCIEKNNVGSIKVSKLKPGDLILFDQYESRLEGHHLTARGHYLSTQKYCGGTLFWDEASSKATVIHQVDLNGMETAQAKIQFEQEAAAVGVPIKQYSIENGIYTSNEFVNEILSKGQGIKHIGVGGYHNNKVSEKVSRLLSVLLA